MLNVLEGSIYVLIQLNKYIVISCSTSIVVLL